MGGGGAVWRMRSRRRRGWTDSHSIAGGKGGRDNWGKVHTTRSGEQEQAAEQEEKNTNINYCTR